MALTLEFSHAGLNAGLFPSVEKLRLADLELVASLVYIIRTRSQEAKDKNIPAHKTVGCLLLCCFVSIHYHTK